MRRHQIALLVLPLALATCSRARDNTELVVTVWSDLSVPADMDEIRLQVSGEEQSVDRPFQLSGTLQPGRFQMPVQLALVPAGAKDLSISVTAVGYLDRTEIVSQQAVLPFIPGQARELVLYLARSCRNVRCGDQSGYTCDNGACARPVAVTTSLLPTYVPGQASVPQDAGASSVGRDGAIAFEAGSPESPPFQDRDTHDVTGGVGAEASDTPAREIGPPPDDVRPDGGPDTIRLDAETDSQTTMGPEVSVDLRSDLRPDLPPDLGPDLPPDLGPDMSPDLQPDLTPDTAPPVLLAYYRCESGSGTALVDFSGNGNDGTLSASGHSFIAGKVGQALALAKAGQGFVSLPQAMFANLAEITIAAWINVATSDSWAPVFHVGISAGLAANTSTGTRYMSLVPRNSGTSLAFAISTDGYSNEQVLTSAALPAGTWRHVAVVLGSGTAMLYVDGQLATASGSVTLRPKDLGPIDYAYLGKSQFSMDPSLDGMLDEVRVYDRALSAAEIKAVYQYTGP